MRDERTRPAMLELVWNRNLSVYGALRHLLGLRNYGDQPTFQNQIY